MYGNFVGIDISGKRTRAVLIKRGLREVKLLKTLSADDLGNPEKAGKDLAALLGDSSILGYNFIAEITDSPL
ncbi:MAG: hypothetical protein ACRENO_09985, partial [Thermodesulfobacteriota bacterium]